MKGFQNKRIRGSVSIFLTLILIPTYLVGVCLADLSVLYGAENIAKNTMNNIVNSIYYQHNTKLLDKYHLLAISHEREVLEDMIRPVAEKNIEQYPSKDSFLIKHNYIAMRLNKFEIEVDEEGSLANPYILENQIVEYMKYKKILDIPIFIDEFIKSYNQSVEDAQVISEKMAYDKKLNKADGKLDKIGRDFTTIKDSSEKINRIIESYNENLRDYAGIKDKESWTNEDRKIANKYNASRNNLSNAINRMDRYYGRLKTNLDNFSEYRDGLLDSKDGWQDYVEGIKNRKLKIIYKNGDFLSNIIFNKIDMDATDSQLAYDQDYLLTMAENLEEEHYIRYLVGNYEEDNISKYLANKEKLNGENSVGQAKKIKKRLIDRINSLFLTEKTNKKLLDYIGQDRLEELTEEIENLGGEKLYKINQNQSDSDKLDNFMDVLSDSKKIEKTRGKAFLDNVLVADYIVSFFPNKLDEDEGFNSKQEYIIFGEKDLDANIAKANNRILITRFLFNSVYAFTDGNIQTQTSILATKLSAGFGFAIPLIQMVLIASLALGESLLDLDDLNRGKEVALIKNKKTWKLGLTSIKEISDEDLGKLGEKFKDYDLQDIFSNTVQSFVLSEAIFEGNFKENFSYFLGDLASDLSEGDYDNSLIKEKLLDNQANLEILSKNSSVEEIGEYVESTAQEIPGQESDGSNFAMDYSNYLLLILLTKLNLGFKNQMLKRVALLIDQDMAEGEYFDISRTYSEFKVNLEVFINTIYVHRILNKKKSHYFDYSIGKGFYEK